jgi:hypothetical protein
LSPLGFRSPSVYCLKDTPMYRVFLFALGLLALKLFFPELVSAFVGLLLQIITLLSETLSGVTPSAYGV